MMMEERNKKEEEEDNKITRKESMNRVIKRRKHPMEEDESKCNVKVQRHDKTAVEKKEELVNHKRNRSKKEMESKKRIPMRV